MRKTFETSVKDIDEIKYGYYTDEYFNRTKKILIEDNYHPNVLMQVFQKKDAILCGIDEVISTIKNSVLSGEIGIPTKWENLKIKALHNGDVIKPWETVMTIEGDYSLFAHLETVYLGVLKRGTMVATNTRRIVDVVNGKPVMFFADRFDHWRVSQADGYASHIGGAIGCSTPANCEWWGGKALGTIPHALIGAYNGDTVKASLKFDEYMPDDVNRIVLVDWDNDCIGTSVKVVEAFRRNKLAYNMETEKYIGSGKGKIYGVRFDTSGILRDKSVTPIGKESLGVCPELCFKARKEFDRRGWNDLKIIVSGGFNEEKVKLFEKLNVPYDAIGVGSSLLTGSWDFTADIVMVDGKLCSKVGRGYNPNPKLEEVK